MAGVPGFGPPKGPGAPVRPSPGPAAWVRAHPAGAAGGIAAGLGGIYLWRKHKGAATPGATTLSSPQSVVPGASTADTTATDLYNQVQPEIDALGSEIAGIQQSLSGSVSVGTPTTTSAATGTDTSAPTVQQQPTPAAQSAQPGVPLVASPAWPSPDPAAPNVVTSSPYGGTQQLVTETNYEGTGATLQAAFPSGAADIVYTDPQGQQIQTALTPGNVAYLQSAGIPYTTK